MNARLFPIALLALCVASSSAAAQQSATTKTVPKYKRHLPKQLVARARITEDSARKIAMAKMPDARIKAVELEDEDGKLIYSYELKIAGKTGEEEVNINALDGSIVAVEHESKQDEKAEKKKEHEEHERLEREKKKEKKP